MKVADLRKDWFIRDIPEGINLTAPGIYEWRIEGIGVYVGKAKHLKRRLRAYPRNVRDILGKRPYHGNPLKPFRKVHLGLHQAYIQELQVRLTILENCAIDEIGERESYWIARRFEEARHGGPAVLNSN